MKLIAVSQRVEVITTYQERRDSLDQRWTALLQTCDLLPLLLPNSTDIVRRILQKIPIEGIVLTGGNDLTLYGGNTPERDETETFLINYAIDNKIPLLGVCRGMQMLLHFYGLSLKKLSGHVATRHQILMTGQPREVNSYHHWGCEEVNEKLEVLASSQDGSIEAIRCRNHPIFGILWHPERETPFVSNDITFIKSLFS